MTDIRNQDAHLKDEIDSEIVARGAVVKHTDFEAAINQNNFNTVCLCVVLVLIGAGLGYILGWAFDQYTAMNEYQFDDYHSESSRWQIFLNYLRGTVSQSSIAGAMLFLCVGAIIAIVAIIKGDRMVLNMTDARPVEIEHARMLHNVVEEMSIAAGLPKPQVFVVDSPALNAFAAGLSPQKSAIAVTNGLLDQCSRDELQGVIGHEMAHILNNDVRYATVVGVMVGLIALVSDSMRRSMLRTRIRRPSSKKNGGGALVIFVVLLLVSILAPLSARLVQMSISRQREYLADATAVKLTRNPQGLVGALRKIAHTKERFEDANRGIQHLFIANPFRDFGLDSSSLMSTHPPLDDRINRLLNLR